MQNPFNVYTRPSGSKPSLLQRNQARLLLQAPHSPGWCLPPSQPRSRPMQSGASDPQTIGFEALSSLCRTKGTEIQNTEYVLLLLFTIS